MLDEEKQEQEPAQIIQQTADALSDGILAFGEGMLRLGEAIERLGESLAKTLLAHVCTDDYYNTAGPNYRRNHPVDLRAPGPA